MEPVRNLPLTMPTLAKDSVTLDVLFVRYPADDKDFNGPVWDEIDELHFSQEARLRLTGNGIRAGILSGPLPMAIEKQIRLSEKSAEKDESAPESVELDKQPKMKRRLLRLQAGRRSNILTMGETERVPEMSLLMLGIDGQPKGRTYRDVMGLFATRAFLNGDGGARIELIPELEHGIAQKRFVPGEGMFKVEFGPPHEVFTDLRIAADLTQGQFLVVGAVPSRPGSLGHRFFTEEKGDVPMNKMLLIRLAQSELDDRFSEVDAGDGSKERLKTLDVIVNTHENTPARKR